MRVKSVSDQQRRFRSQVDLDGFGVAGQPDALTRCGSDLAEEVDVFGVVQSVLVVELVGKSRVQEPEYLLRCGQRDHDVVLDGLRDFVGPRLLGAAGEPRRACVVKVGGVTSAGFLRCDRYGLRVSSWGNESAALDSWLRNSRPGSTSLSPFHGSVPVVFE